MMNEKLIENLKAAKALIDTPDKWIKNDSTHTDCRCAALACSKIARKGDLVVQDIDRMWAALHAELPVDWQTGDGEYGVAIGNFNDHPDTTHADIMALFDRAIAAAEAAQ